MSACPNASRSSHVHYQLNSEAEDRRPAPPSRAVVSHGRHGSGSSIGSAYSTASFFVPSSSSPHHRHTNSDSSLSSISSGVQSPDKRRSAQLPTAAPASVHTEADEWAMRPNDAPRPTQIAEELNKFAIHVDLTEADVGAMLRGGQGQAATVPSTNVMRIAIVGLTGYICEVRPRSHRISLTSDDVIFSLVAFLRTKVTKREALVHRERHVAVDIAEGSRRCDLLPQGERTRLEGFTLLDEGENLWRLG